MTKRNFLRDCDKNSFLDQPKASSKMAWRPGGGKLRRRGNPGKTRDSEALKSGQPCVHSAEFVLKLYLCYTFNHYDHFKGLLCVNAGDYQHLSVFIGGIAKCLKK